MHFTRGSTSDVTIKSNQAGGDRTDVAKERDVCIVTGSYRSSQLGVFIRKER